MISGFGRQQLSLMGNIVSNKKEQMEIIINVRDGEQFQLCVKKTDTIGSLKKKIQKKEGVPPRRQTIMNKDFEMLKDEQLLSECEVTPGSTLFLRIENIKKDIGIFDTHPNDPFRKFLIEERKYSQEEEKVTVRQIVESLKANGESEFKIKESEASKEILQGLIRFADFKYEEAIAASSEEKNKDFKINLTRDQLLEKVGEEFVKKLQRFFGDSYSEIILRRCQAHELFINFHTDVSEKTLQLCLNDESEYQGGKLVFAHGGRFQYPSRRRGMMTVHDNRIAHGVTLLRSGTRYGLFLLKKRE